MKFDGHLLHSSIAAVCPIDGVSFANPEDSATWMIQFRAEATAEQRSAAQEILAAFDVLQGVKRRAFEAIDDDAERVRLRYITRGVGQSMTYREKLEQAEEVVAAGQAAADAMTAEQRIATYPTLAASVGIEADSLWECAALVLNRYNQWAALSYAIEQARLAGKKAIDAAADADGVAAALEAVTWPS